MTVHKTKTKEITEPITSARIEGVIYSFSHTNERGAKVKPITLVTLKTRWRDRHAISFSK